MRKRWFRPVEELIQEHEAEEDALYSTTWKNRAIFWIILTVIAINVILTPMVIMVVISRVWYENVLVCLFSFIFIGSVANIGINQIRYNLFRYRKAKERERKKQEEFLKTYKYLKKDNEQEKDQSASQTGLTADTIHEKPENKQ